jgi:hypothetical protein
MQSTNAFDIAEYEKRAKEALAGLMIPFGQADSE